MTQKFSPQSECVSCGALGTHRPNCVPKWSLCGSLPVIGPLTSMSRPARDFVWQSVKVSQSSPSLSRLYTFSRDTGGKSGEPSITMDEERSRKRRKVDSGAPETLALPSSAGELQWLLQFSQSPSPRVVAGRPYTGIHWKKPRSPNRVSNQPIQDLRVQYRGKPKYSDQGAPIQDPERILRPAVLRDPRAGRFSRSSLRLVLCEPVQ